MTGCGLLLSAWCAVKNNEEYMVYEMEIGSASHLCRNDDDSDPENEDEDYFHISISNLSN